jgi:hypothetical protein
MAENRLITKYSCEIHVFFSYAVFVPDRFHSGPRHGIYKV